MTTEHAIVYAKAFSSVLSMLKMLGNKSSSYVKLEQGVSKISKNGISEWERSWGKIYNI